MKLPRLLTLSLIFVLAFAVSAQAEGWKPSLPSLPSLPSMPSMPKIPSMPNLNPFKQQDSHPASIGKQNESREWPGMSRKPAVKQEEATPSMWQRVSSGTKSTWTKTKSALTPWRTQPQEPKAIVITGSNSTFNQMVNGKHKQPVKKTSWFWGDDADEQPKKINSVSDFIGGKRPQ